ncbi:MAG: hypothetical protein IT244_13230 [Bacteroidia bacterium]|nr:hypothetical protein [Bacteroidia bacterium]
MPVIIDEIIITAQVESNSNRSVTSGNSVPAADAKLAKVIEELKRILKEKNER